MRQTSASTEVHRYRWFALALLGGVQFLLVLDDTVVNVALASIRDDLGFGSTALTWVVNAYLLAFGGLLLVGGRAGDVLGRRRVLVAGLWVFALASLACGLAQEPWQLVAGRAAQGVGAALVSPTALALITRLFTDTQERARALSVWGGLAVLGGTTGVVLSGALTGLVSWRLVFLINLPPVVAALALVPRLVPESRDPARPPLRVVPALLATAAVGCLVQGVLVTADADAGAGRGVVWLLAAIALAVLFLTVDARGDSRLVPPSLFGSPLRLMGGAGTLVLSAAFFAVSVLLMLHLQTVLGYTPLRAGLAYLPYAGGTLVGVAASAAVQRRLGLRGTGAAALVLGAIGIGVLAGLPVDGSYSRDVLPGLLVAAVGSGLGFPTFTAAAMSGTGDEDAGVAAAVLSSMQQLGSVLGLAALVGVAARRSATLVSAGLPVEAASTEALSAALLVAASVLVLAGVLVLVLPRSPRGARARRPPGQPAT